MERLKPWLMLLALLLMALITGFLFRDPDAYDPKFDEARGKVYEGERR